MSPALHDLARILDEPVGAAATRAPGRPGARRCRRRRRSWRRWSPRLRAACPAADPRISSTPSLNDAVLNSGRGSRPGFSSSARMSFTVGTPNCSSAKSSGSQRCAASPSCRSARCTGTPGRADDPLDDRIRLGVHGGRVERVVAVRDRAGSRPPARTSGRRRAAPSAAAWRVAERAVLVAIRDDVLRERLGQARDARQQRRRRRVHVGADRVHAVFDDGVELPARAAVWLTSCWYWPTPIAFGSICTSSASGSCSRRAIDTAPRSDTSSVGNSCARELRRRVDRRARLGHDHLRQPRAPACRAISSPASLSVSRDAVPLPIEIELARGGVAHSDASVCSEPSQSLRGSCG